MPVDTVPHVLFCIAKYWGKRASRLLMSPGFPLTTYGNDNKGQEEDGFPDPRFHGDIGGDYRPHKKEKTQIYKSRKIIRLK